MRCKTSMKVVRSPEFFTQKRFILDVSKGPKYASAAVRSEAATGVFL